jgi:regulator of sigma E protease
MGVENFFVFHGVATIALHLCLQPVLLLASTLAFVILLTGLILLHELGHFLVAIFFGVTVEEFGFGLPPRIRTLFMWEGTRFSLNWIPFGGFVRLKGENAVTERERRARGSFSGANAFARCSILVAGVTMNFVLALALYLFGFSTGRWVPTYLTLDAMRDAASRGEIQLELQVLIDNVLPDGPAAVAGLQNETVLVSVDGKPVTVPDDVIAAQTGKTKVTYRVRDRVNDAERDVVVTLRDGKTGVLLAAVPKTLAAPVRSLVDAAGLALREARVVTMQTVFGIFTLLRSLLTQGTVPDGITGIVGIAQLTYTSVQQGFLVYLRLVALLSLSLAALNILPIPALDGGRLAFVLYEVITRKPADRRIELFTNTLGFAFLILLILVVTVYDVVRLFR